MVQHRLDIEADVMKFNKDQRLITAYRGCVHADSNQILNEKQHQILNEKNTELKQKQHQNLNNLFYDIGWRVSKYVHGLQQIMPAVNQLETIRRHRALTQLGQVSPVSPESPSSVVLPHSGHHKARIVPQSYVALSRSLTIGALTLTLSPPLTDLSSISNYLLALSAAAKLFCVAR